MEVQLIREELRLEQPMGMGRSDAVVTGEVTLPGGLREETRVLAAQAAASIDSAEASSGRVNVRGRVSFRVLYTQGDPTKVNAVEASADFVHPCQMPGMTTGAVAEARVQVKRVEARASGGRMSLRAELEAEVCASSLLPVEAVTGIEGTDDVQVQSYMQEICRTTARGSAEAMLRQELELPSGMGITEALCASAVPVLEAVTGGVGRVGLTGHVQLEAVHASSLQGRPLVVTRHSIPFAQSVELIGEDGDKLDGCVQVKDVAVALQEDAEGRQSLRAEILLGLEGWSEATETLSVFSEAYTTCGDELRLTGRTILCRTGGGNVNAAESLRAAMRLPEGTPPLRTALAAFVQPVAESVETNAGRTVVSGVLDATLLYMTDGSDAPVSVRTQEPFRVTYAAEVAPDSLMSLYVTEVEAAPVTSDRVELRCILHMKARGIEAAPLALVTGGETVVPSPMTEDVVLYFTQPGEKLWDVARRYRVPVEGIRALNPGIQGELQPGQGVVVWRRMAAASV